VAVAYLLLFIAFFDNFAMLPTVAPYAEQLGARLLGAGVAVGAYSLTNLAFNVVGGVLLDRVGRRRLLIVALVLVAGAMLLYPRVTTLEGLVLVRLVHGVAGGLLVPAVFTVLGDRAPVTARGRAMGRAGAVIGAAAVVAPAMAGVIRQVAGFAPVFLTVAATAAAGAVLAAVGVGETRPAVAEPASGGARAGLGAVARRRGLPSACATAFLLTGAIGSLAAFLPLHVEGLGRTAGVTGALFTTFALVAAVVMLSPAAALGDRRGLAGPLVPGFGALAAALLLLAAGPGPGWTALAAGLFGVGYGLVFPAMAGAAVGAGGPGERGRALGLLMAAFSLGFVVVPPLGGAVGDALPTVGPFVVGGVLCVVGAGAAAWSRARGGGRRQPPRVLASAT
jgi:MFS transporter, DHA1 family, multidrug resistance protein